MESITNMSALRFGKAPYVHILFDVGKEDSKVGGVCCSSRHERATEANIPVMEQLLSGPTNFSMADR